RSSRRQGASAGDAERRRCRDRSARVHRYAAEGVTADRNKVVALAREASVVKKWYYLHEGKPQGPVGADVLQRMALAGALVPQDLIWPEDKEREVAVQAQSALLFPASSPDLTVPEPPQTEKKDSAP